jgi:hypothetical protein
LNIPRFNALCLSFSIFAISCKTNEAAKDQSESETAAVAVGESEGWGNKQKFLAISNNALKARNKCNADAAAIALTMVAETIPAFGAAAETTDLESVRELVESGNLARLGGEAASIVEIVKNIVFLSKNMMDKNFKAPEWSPAWDQLKDAYAGNFVKLSALLEEDGEEEACKESITSINNVIMTMFPKKK